MFSNVSKIDCCVFCGSGSRSNTTFSNSHMVDRILHIGHKLAGAYDTALLHRAAEVYIYKGPGAVVPHLTTTENMAAPEAEILAQKIAAEMRAVNRQVLLQYGALAVIFITLLLAGLFSQSYIFAGIFALPLLLLVRSAVTFIRRNPIR